MDSMLQHGSLVMDMNGKLFPQEIQVKFPLNLREAIFCAEQLANKSKKIKTRGIYCNYVYKQIIHYFGTHPHN